jgi:hypothetical protein
MASWTQTTERWGTFSRIVKTGGYNSQGYAIKKLTPIPATCRITYLTYAFVQGNNKIVTTI